MFFLRPKPLCITRPRVWCNINVNYLLAIMKGDNISDAEHELLMVSIKIGISGFRLDFRLGLVIFCLYLFLPFFLATTAIAPEVFCYFVV